MQPGGWLDDRPCEPNVSPASAGGGEASDFLHVPPRSPADHLNLTSHLVVRGTYLPSTVRCSSDGKLFRYRPYLPRPSYKPEWLESRKAIQCYADLRVNDYMVGSGPPALTVLVARSSSYEGERTTLQIERSRRAWERVLLVGGPDPDRFGVVPQGGIVGREGIMFLGPSWDFSIEAWTSFYIWGVERRDDDTVIAVNPQRYLWQGHPDIETYRSQLEIELSAFKTAVQAAQQARLAEDGGRIGPDADQPMLVTDANRLGDFFRGLGAYEHPDGPPIRPAPACGLSVSNQLDNPGLMMDCQALLFIKDSLRGTGTLDWGTASAIGSWEGVTTGGTPPRVTKLLLPNKSLTGTVSARLGVLDKLTHLDLSGNSLTGVIVRELGHLDDLVEARLSGNSLTGCIPYGLKDVTTNDFASLNRLYCPPAPEAPTGTVEPSSIPLTWKAVANTTKYRVQYRDDIYVGPWTLDDESITATSRTVDGLLCEENYAFHVSAYGDGTTYAAEWSDPSDSLIITTGSCTPPVFPVPSYRFTVSEDAEIGSAIGTVTATDDSDLPVSYSIYGWYSEVDGGSDLFGLEPSTGTFTVDGDLTGRAGTTVDTYVDARDVIGGVKQIIVTIVVTGS